MNNRGKLFQRESSEEQEDSQLRSFLFQTGLNFPVSNTALLHFLTIPDSRHVFSAELDIL